MDKIKLLKYRDSAGNIKYRITDILVNNDVNAVNASPMFLISNLHYSLPNPNTPKTVFNYDPSVNLNVTDDLVIASGFNFSITAMLQADSEITIPVNGVMSLVRFCNVYLFEVVDDPSLSNQRLLEIGDKVVLRPTAYSYASQNFELGVGVVISIANSIVSSRKRKIRVRNPVNQFVNTYYETDLLLVDDKDIPKKVIEDITIGSDIEFSFIKNGKQVNVDQVMHPAFRETGEVGTDHGGGVGEFRPRFADGPLEHVKNLKAAIRHIVEGGFMLEDTYLDSSHILGQHVLGGHIHFGIKDPILIQKCKKNLDYWLLPTIQPLFPKEVFMERVRRAYGRIDGEAIRNQAHGFEYRLVPSFIFNEGVAKGIFCLAYAIVKLTVNGKLKVRMDEMDNKWILSFIENYNKYNITELHQIREESIRKLLNKNSLGGLDKHVNSLFDAIRHGAEFSGDIAEGWGMEYEYVQHSRSQMQSTEGGGLVIGSATTGSALRW